jgi:predicted nucleic acid-binding protein
MARARPKKTPPRRFVLDCSIALAWFFADEANDYADAVASALPTAVVIVPSLFHLELANTLVVGERHGRSTAAQAAAFLTRLAALPIVVDEQTMKRAWAETIALARAHGLSAYDAAYLELALRESLPLATLDDPLAAAAKAVGIRRFEP